MQLGSVHAYSQGSSTELREALLPKPSKSCAVGSRSAAEVVCSPALAAPSLSALLTLLGCPVAFSKGWLSIFSNRLAAFPAKGTELQQEADPERCPQQEQE